MIKNSKNVQDARGHEQIGCTAELLYYHQRTLYERVNIYSNLPHVAAEEVRDTRLVTRIGPYDLFIYIQGIWSCFGM